MTFKPSVFILLLGLLIPFLLQAEEETLLLQSPTIHAEHIAFIYAGDVWIMDRADLQPRRLTVHPGLESRPMLSPDGQWLAFSGQYDGNTDVYVLPVQGGTPQRLTFHPGSDDVRGWSPDSKTVLFASSRQSSTGRYSRLFTIDREGGFPQVLPMPMAERGTFSPDQNYIAYTPIRDAFITWKRYRGGMTTPIWIFNRSTFEIEEIPHENASDTHPVWLGDRVFFLSDRNHYMNVFEYNTVTKTLRQITFHDDFDVKSLAGFGNELVYEQGGRLHLFNVDQNEAQTLNVFINPDLPSKRPHFSKAAAMIRSFDLSPSGVRALFEARGDIFTVPAGKGDIRNITNSSGVHERYPAWSPDGRWIAYLSDAGGEYQLHLSDQKGTEKGTVINLGDVTFYYHPRWSPDSKKITYTDKRLNLFYIDLTAKKPVRIDTDTYSHPQRSLDPVWSPDSRWIAYTKRLDNHLRAVFLFDLEKGKIHQITDGMSDATSAAFSRDGKYLFFAASTNYALNTGWLDLSSIDRPVERSIYAVVLNQSEDHPFGPQSDEEEVQGNASKESKDEKEKKDEAVKVTIDLAGIDQRIVALPLPARDYTSLQSAADGKLFYLETIPNQSGATLQRFDMKERKAEKFLEGVNAYVVSADGKKLLYAGQGDTYAIVETGTIPSAGAGKLNLDNMEVYIDPMAEWKQMFDEVWRIERDFFYAENMHGANWPAIKKQYQPFLKYVGHRSDLNALFADMIGEMVVGHNYVGGGDYPAVDDVPVGLLGADYEIDQGFYRFKKIYSGLNWNPDLRAPLTEPGVDVREGDYLLAVNGTDLKMPVNLYSLFEKTADKQVTLTVNARPVKAGAREVTVVPIASEAGLRNRDWVESNRKKVDELTSNRVAYVYLPNTAAAGYTYFNRYYFSQLDREAVIIDERFNGGGFVADYVIDLLDRPVLSYWFTRDGKDFASPNASIFGPRAMIINEYAGSGGDALPLFFRRRGLGKLIGKRTWGGLVGIYDYPPLMDGGFITAPRLAIYSPDGQWEVENEGVPPDIEVEMLPQKVIEGHDPQLEEAVRVIMEELKAKPFQRPTRPPDPVRVR